MYSIAPLHPIDMQLIHLALQEDLGENYSDVTTSELCKNLHHVAQAKIISKQDTTIVMCGLSVVKTIMSQLAPTARIETNYHDGDCIAPHATVLSIYAPGQALLMAERTILNFLQHLCRIATYTAQFVQCVQHTNMKILDTRKTVPGYRHLEKYAVQCGGGVNHRMGLYDAVMIKDTHIDLLGGMENALQTLSSDVVKKIPVIVEVRDINELQILLALAPEKVTRVLLDNMLPQEMSQCVHLCQGILPTEASGNIHLENILEIAKTGVNYASIGKLTHSAPHIDLSMRCFV